MGLGEVVGGLAVAGTLVLIGLAMTDDGGPDSLTGADSVALAGGAAPDTTSMTVATSETLTTDTAAPTSEPAATTEPAPTTEPAAATTSRPATTTDPPATTAATSDPRPGTSNPATSTTVDTLPEDRRPTIRVQVLNAGVEEGAAAFVSGVLKQTGFEPVDPRDAARAVDGTVVMYAPGREAEAATVNAVIKTDGANVRVAPANDPNWSASGGEIDVLVLLGQG
jgi:hypothetical protein